MIKKIGISVFIAAILAQSGFVAFSSALRVVFHKLEMFEMIESSLMTGILKSELDVFTEAQLINADWEHSGEFELNGKKYDVLEVVEQNGIKTYKCINDSKESILVNQLDKSGKVSKILDDVLKKFQINSLRLFANPSTLNGFQIVFFERFDNHYNFSFLKSDLRPPSFF